MINVVMIPLSVKKTTLIDRYHTKIQNRIECYFIIIVVHQTILYCIDPVDNVPSCELFVCRVLKVVDVINEPFDIISTTGIIRSTTFHLTQKYVTERIRDLPIWLQELTMFQGKLE